MALFRASAQKQHKPNSKRFWRETKPHPPLLRPLLHQSLPPPYPQPLQPLQPLHLPRLQLPQALQPLTVQVVRLRLRLRLRLPSLQPQLQRTVTIRRRNPQNRAPNPNPNPNLNLTDPARPNRPKNRKRRNRKVRIPIRSSQKRVTRTGTKRWRLQNQLLQTRLLVVVVAAVAVAVTAKQTTTRRAVSVVMVCVALFPLVRGLKFVARCLVGSAETYDGDAILFCDLCKSVSLSPLPLSLFISVLDRSVVLIAVW